VVFDQAYSNSPWTRTSVVSLFTGLHPESHGVHDKEDAAPDSLVTMAEWFRDAGFETVGFSSNISVSAKFLLDQGFEQFTYFPHEPYFAGREEENPGYVPVSGMFPPIREWLRRPHERPFFLYIHTTDPHAQYRPPPVYRRWGLRSADMYDGEVLFSDDYFGRLVDLLALQGVLDETLVIFTADHGEELHDHGQSGHGHTLYNELLRVPLVVRHPSLVPGHRAGPVRLIDLLPTLAEWYGLPLELEGVQGRSILPVLRGARDPWPRLRFVLGQIRYPSKIVGESLQMGGFKMIHTVQDRRGKRDVWELYDVQRDPGERDDRIEASPEQVAAYRQRLDQLQEETARAAHATRKTTLDEETERTLRALGYLQ
jgi:arylsulfatase A-like enzyme